MTRGGEEGSVAQTRPRVAALRKCKRRRNDQQARLALSHHLQQGRSCGMALSYSSMISNTYHSMAERATVCVTVICFFTVMFT